MKKHKQRWTIKALKMQRTKSLKCKTDFSSSPECHTIAFYLLRSDEKVPWQEGRETQESKYEENSITSWKGGGVEEDEKNQQHSFQIKISQT